MIISVDAEKAFDRMQYAFMIETLNKPGIERNFFSLVKRQWNNPFPGISVPFPNFLWIKIIGSLNFVILKNRVPQRKTQNQMASLAMFYQILREELTPIFHQLPKTRRRENTWVTHSDRYYPDTKPRQRLCKKGKL